MREEEAAERQKELDRMDRQEEIFDWFERFRGVLIFVPVLIFLCAAGWFLANYLNLFNGENGEHTLITRGYPNDCKIEVYWDGEFSDGEIRSVNDGISNKICGHFEDVERMLISRNDEGKVDVKVDVKDWFLQYNFVKKSTDWRIKKYFRREGLASMLNG